MQKSTPSYGNYICKKVIDGFFLVLNVHMYNDTYSLYNIAFDIQIIEVIPI